MLERDIELTPEETALLGKIDFEPSSRKHDATHWRSVGSASQKLMESLIERKAIPEVRMKFFSDPVFNIGGRGRSRLQIFEMNGTRGAEILRHPHFLKYLWYFIYGPDLPRKIIEAFRQEVAACGPLTSGDILPLGESARRLTRTHRLDAKAAAEEFYKLALECGLDATDARSVRDAVRKAS